MIGVADGNLLFIDGLVQNNLDGRLLDLARKIVGQNGKFLAARGGGRQEQLPAKAVILFMEAHPMAARRGCQCRIALLAAGGCEVRGRCPGGLA